MGEGFPVVLSEMATAAGNALGAHPGRGKPGLHRSRFRSLWVGKLGSDLIRVWFGIVSKFHIGGLKQGRNGSKGSVWKFLVLGKRQTKSIVIIVGINRRRAIEEVLQWASLMVQRVKDPPAMQETQEMLKLMSIESVMPSSHLFHCRPLLLLPPIPPSIRVNQCGRNPMLSH